MTRPLTPPPARHSDADLSVRPIESRDLGWVREELHRNWRATQISSRGKWFDADSLPGFVAEAGGSRIGLVTHTAPVRGGECEVVTLSCSEPGRGAGSLLLRACERVAREGGCSRLFLTTTNDNLHALGFYQRRGWRVVALHRGAMDEARRIKPEIPLVGMNGIPMHDEIELELRLS